MVFKEAISPQLSAYLHFLHQEQNISIFELCHRYKNVSRATIYRHAKRTVRNHKRIDNRKTNMGRPKKLSPRDQRHVLRSLIALREVDKNFSSKRIRVEGDVNNSSDRTVRRYLNHEGYYYLQSRKKGLMSKADMKKRVVFAKKMLKEHEDGFWKNGVTFYLDGTSFVHKRNPADQARAPKGRVWRKRNEGLKQGCTSKGKKVGHGGNVVHVMVAISHGHGVIGRDQYKKNEWSLHGVLCFKKISWYVFKG